MQRLDVLLGRVGHEAHGRWRRWRRVRQKARRQRRQHLLTIASQRSAAAATRIQTVTRIVHCTTRVYTRLLIIKQQKKTTKSVALI